MFLLVHINPNAIFSQASDTTQPLRQFDRSAWVISSQGSPTTGHATISMDVIKPDTLRAIILVTLFPNGIAHARMGFVVIEQGKRPVYLDCRKKALKLPQVGWGWEVNPNYKQK